MIITLPPISPFSHFSFSYTLFLPQPVDHGPARRLRTPLAADLYTEERLRLKVLTARYRPSKVMASPPLSRDELADRYLEQLPFKPYPFQEEALLAWFSAEQGVLVCAPTGMGKTLIAEAAMFEALHTGTHGLLHHAADRPDRAEVPRNAVAGRPAGASLPATWAW